MVVRLSRTERLRRFLYRAVFVLSRPNTYILTAWGLLALLVLGTALIWEIELRSPVASQLSDFGNALAYMVQNVSGVWVAAPPPQTVEAKSIALVVVLVAATLRALLIAAIVSIFVNRVLAQGKGKGRTKMENHIVICGWNSRVKQLIEVLQREAFGAGVPIVLLAQLDQNPYPDLKLTFISGNSSSMADLERAGIKSARAAIVVTDESDKDPHMDSTYDARAVLTVLALKAANPQLHVVAQLRDPANRQHFERARANEIIASAEMSEGLLARSALNFGIADAFSQLLRLDTPQEVYIIDAPADLEGKTFQAALVHEQLRDGRILLGVIEGGNTILCPPPGFNIHGDSRLIVLGNVRPRVDH
jgi:voltage-gated potassium channel